MERIKGLCVIFILFFSTASIAQTVEIKGKVMVDDVDIEGIHIINKTSNRFTTTNVNGHFIIPAKLNDTIIFSAIKYKPKEIIIDVTILTSKALTVYLTELIIELNQVIVGKILTGNLLSDIENSDAKRDINFYDLGIPGYTGKPLTQTERRLKEASDFELGLGGGLYGFDLVLPINPLINALNGRTKMLKNRLDLEKRNVCISRIVSNFSKALFGNHELEDNYRTEFFYYCSEDPEFLNLCALNSDVKIFEFLEERLKIYKTRIGND